MKSAPDFTVWHGKPYYSLDAWCKNTYGEKLYKIALNAGFSCPNRDGTLGTGGCIFCSRGGSGEFAVSFGDSDPAAQLKEGIRLLHAKKTGNRVIAYFQAYTNTYGPTDRLRTVYEAALKDPSVCGISIATRPDCVGDEVCMLLAALKKEYPDKFIWIELGLQTIHEKTALFIRRGYELPCFEDACRRLRAIDIPVIVHIILGLPGEETKEILATISYLNQISPFGVKLQLMHVLAGTGLAVIYEKEPFHIYSPEEYLEVLIACIEHLSPRITIHRVTGDGPGKLLLAPDWSRNKRFVLNSLHRQMKERQTYQGRSFHDSGSADTV